MSVQLQVTSQEPVPWPAGAQQTVADGPSLHGSPGHGGHQALDTDQMRHSLFSH